MGSTQHHLHDGKGGAALAVHVIPRATRNEIVEILNDGTVKIRLKSPPDETKLNENLIQFLSEILDVSAANVEIVAGESKRRKLVSILGLDTEKTQNRIIQNVI